MNRNILKELGVFHPEGGVFSLINQCITQNGSFQLEQWILNPLKEVEKIIERQEIIQFWQNRLPIQFDYELNNGTMVMIEDFLGNQENYNLKPNGWNIYISQQFQRLFKRASQNHLIFHFEYIHSLLNAVDTLHKISQDFDHNQNKIWLSWKVLMHEVLDHTIVQKVLKPVTSYSLLEKAEILYQFKKMGRQALGSAMQVFAIWDAWQSLAQLALQKQWVFPEIMTSENPVLSMEEIYFPAIKNPIPFSLNFDEKEHFLMLTGANMSGKSTLLRTIGLTYALAQMGAPLPAKKVVLSPINGIYTNLSVRDDIYKGESFFYAEVLRMKEAAETIRSSSNYLFLMDELFKGTNFQDAFDSTRLIMDALRPYENHLFILSTHIYELAEEYQHKNHIKAVYMETVQSEEFGYQFTYKLKDGVSKDKIGSLILKKEGILDLLKHSS